MTPTAKRRAPLPIEATVVHHQAVVATPLGPLCLQSDGRAIVGSDFRSGRASPTREPADALLREAREQVRAYFAQRLRRFDLPLHLSGTRFQTNVWKAVSELAFGQIVSYGDVARAIGCPLAHRGVAAAIGRSQLDLFVPAHRVIGSDGRIKGASAGSLRRKLLAFEGVIIR